MKHDRSLTPYVLVACLVIQGCAAYSGVEATNLALLESDSSRGDIEEILGEPLLNVPFTHGSLAIYQYDSGASPSLSQNFGGCVGACAMAHLLILPLSVLAHPSIVSDQKRKLSVIYDNKDHFWTYHKQDISHFVENYETIEQRACNNGEPLDGNIFMEIALYYKLGLPPLRQDLWRAYIWYEHAFDSGRSDAKTYRDALKRDMSSWTVNELTSAQAAGSPANVPIHKDQFCDALN